MDEKWIFVERVTAMGQGFDSYVNEAQTKGKTVWFDGFVEVYELG